MPRFHYKAVSASGEVVEGELEAKDRAAAVERLRREGNVPIRAEERRGAAAGQRRVERRTGAGKIPAKQVGFFTRELSVLLGAGLTLDRSLSILASLADNAVLRAVVERILERVRSGKSLADGLEAEGSVFPSYYAGMVRAGEAGGTLEAVLERLAETMERAAALKDEVVTALLYPMLVVIVAIASLAILIVVVIPELRPLFEDAGTEISLAAAVLLGFSDLARTLWWLPLVAVAGLWLGLRQMMSDEAGRARLDAFYLGLPLVGDLIVKLEAARLSRTLGTLLANGVSALNAVSMAVGAIGNRKIAASLSEVRGRLAKGEGLSRPLADLEIFPEMAVRLIEIGEESGRLEAMLLQVAEIYDAEVKRTINRMLALLVPAITIGLGLVIVVIIGTVLQALLSAYELPL